MKLGATVQEKDLPVEGQRTPVLEYVLPQFWFRLVSHQWSPMPCLLQKPNAQHQLRGEAPSAACSSWAALLSGGEVILHPQDVHATFAMA